MSLHSTPSIRDVSPERTPANVANDPTQNSNLPETLQTEELVEQSGKSISETKLPIQIPPELSAQQRGDEESSTLATDTGLSRKRPQVWTSITPPIMN
jgi:hypothetical protein